MRTLSIIFVTHSSARYIVPFLESVMRATEKIDTQIIAVDNNSTDGTAAGLEKLPSVLCIRNSENVGFARACNQGIRSSEGEFVLLLNTDMVVKEGAVDALLEFLRSHPAVGVAGARLENPDGTLQHSIGRFPTVLKLIGDRIPVINAVVPVYFERRAPVYSHIQYPDWVAGSCMLIRRTALQRAGMFDERYFMYMEDVELCYRMRRAGWQVGYCPDATVMHHDLGKTPEKRYNKFINQRIGLLRFFYQYRSRASCAIVRAALRLELGIRRLPESGELIDYRAVLKTIP
ncbi:MAG: glycosyltransferase family 2 protein [Patescibacteria group bacterium]|nr:glycosyltransferase family 2 protein [Patescibacteria group bacterium]MDD5715422.1 glycosyltransferase family 2 protein [Patescibacteria group bacterium]